MKKIFTYILILLAETVATLLLVLVFFGIFLFVLNLQFPSGYLFESMLDQDQTYSNIGDTDQERSRYVFELLDDETIVFKKWNWRWY